LGLLLQKSMKFIRVFQSFSILLSIILMTSCGSGESNSSAENSAKDLPVQKKEVVVESVVEAQEVKSGLINKGVGPITEVILAETINQELASAGKSIYDEKCVICHKLEEKLIGPASKGILDRRSPEWVMNMILNPDVMIVKDPDAKALYEEYNKVPMLNQNLNQDDARAILEYFRTI